VDFSKFQGESFRALLNFLNAEIGKPFVAVDFDVSAEGGHKPAGFLFVASEDKCHYISYQFHGPLTGSIPPAMKH
jgi:hypothetical protein